MTVPILTVLIASLVGSLHCVGMCGAFVAFACGTGDQPGIRHKTLLNAAYNGGRLVTYCILGAIAGVLGHVLDLGGDYIGIQQAAAIFAGLVMVVFGAVTLMKIKGIKLPKLPLPNFLVKTVTLGQGLAMAMRPVPRALTIGLLTTLLPCGWLYAFALVAAGTGSPVYGALTMAIFWLGTLPYLVAVGAGIQSLTGVLGKHLPTATAVLIVLVGLYSVVNRLGKTNAVYAQPPTAALTDDDKPMTRQEAVEQLKHIHESLPCCVEDDEKQDTTDK